MLLNPRTVKMEKDGGRRFLSSGLSIPFYRELKTPDKGSIEALAYLHFRNRQKRSGASVSEDAKM